jgi:hypothetical protein
MITQAELHLNFLYDKNTGEFVRIQKTGKHKLAGSINLAGYRVIGFKSKDFLAHRLAWLYIYGCLPKCDIDHIDENKSNNAIANLRLATRSQNMQNVSKANKNNLQGFRGVYFNKNTHRYMASIWIDGKSKHLGYFECIEEAKKARKQGEILYHPRSLVNYDGIKPRG